MRRYRPAISVVLFVLVGLLRADQHVGDLGRQHASTTATTFSQRAVEVLDSERRAQGAGQQAHRAAGPGRQPAGRQLPARVPVRRRGRHRHRHLPRRSSATPSARIHEALLEGRGTGVGLDLSDSLGHHHEHGAARTGDGAVRRLARGSSGGLANSLDDVTRPPRRSCASGTSRTSPRVDRPRSPPAGRRPRRGRASSSPLDRRQAVVRLGLALVLGRRARAAAPRSAAELAVRAPGLRLRSGRRHRLRPSRGHRRPAGASGCGSSATASSSPPRQPRCALHARARSASRMRAWAGRRRRHRGGTRRPGARAPPGRAHSSR